MRVASYENKLIYKIDANRIFLYERNVYLNSRGLDPHYPPLYLASEPSEITR